MHQRCTWIEITKLLYRINKQIPLLSDLPNQEDYRIEKFTTTIDICSKLLNHHGSFASDQASKTNLYIYRFLRRIVSLLVLNSRKVQYKRGYSYQILVSVVFA